MAADQVPMRPYPSVSIVIPLYNEEDGVVRLLDEIAKTMDTIPEPTDAEVICVDDGSSDRTLGELQRHLRVYPFLRIISFSRNFGHQAAVSAGLEKSRGDVVMVIDGDLQDDPMVLDEFISEYRRGADVVYARRVDRKESWWLRAAYSLHYRLLSMMSSVEIPLDAGDFSLVSRRVVDLLNGLPERQRYIRGLRAWVGFKQVGIPVERRHRVTGRSKYGLTGLLRLATDGLVAFSIAPLRIATLLGLAGLAFGFGYGAYAVVARVITGSVPQGFTTLALLQIGFGGAVLLMLGVLGEYVGRIYEEIKGRPLYVVANTYGYDDG